MKRLCMMVAITAMLGVTLPVRAEVVTFDDLGGTIEPLPSSYRGFDWSGSFYYLNPELYHPVSGYMAGMVSSPNVAFNGFESCMSTVSFDSDAVSPSISSVMVLVRVPARMVSVPESGV